MTNESDTYAQAEPGKAPGSTFERKEMSFKTLRKRIALVAVAALAVTGLSTVPANAAVTRTAATQVWAVTQAYASSGATASQVVGGTVTLTFSETVTAAAVGDVIHTISSSGIGAISSATVTAGDTTEEKINPAGSAAASQTVIFPTTSVSAVIPAGGSDPIATAALVTTTIVASSATAGTQTLTALTYSSNGSPSGSYTATITWIAATAAGVNAANSSFYIAPAGTTCVYGTSKTTDMVTASAAVAITSGTSASVPVVCVSARDAAGNSVGLASTVVYNSLGGASISPSETSSGSGKTTATALNTASTTGKATVTAILTDIYGNVITLTTPYTYYGSLKTLELKNVTYAASYDGVAMTTAGGGYTSYATGAAGDIGTATSKVGLLILVGKDANGNQIDLATQANGTGSTFTVDSSALPGAPAAKTSDALGTTVAASNNATAGKDVAKLGGNAVVVTCGTVSAEKLTITAFGTTSTGADVVSNSVTFYCSNLANKVSVSVTGQAVNVNVVDANEFPVADGTSVSLVASNGSVVAPSSKSTENGKFATAATFIANSTAATSSVTAIVGSKSGTSTPVAGTGSTIEAQVTSLVAAIAKLQKAINKINKRLAR